MSGGGEQSQVTEQIRGLIDQWTVSLAEVVASMADQKPEVRWDATGAPPAGPDLLWWEQPFQVGPGVVVWVATPRSTWEYAGTLTLKAAGLETVETNEARNTWLEILGQSLSGLARSIGGVLGKRSDLRGRRGARTRDEPGNGGVGFPDVRRSARDYALDRLQSQAGGPHLASGGRRQCRSSRRSTGCRGRCGRAVGATVCRPPWTCCWMSNCQ